jgi:hypothetical protein
MRTNLLVKDGTDGTPLCVIEGQRVFDVLKTSVLTLAGSAFRGQLSGTGKKETPYAINTFIDINTYIEVRNQNRVGTLYFTFCGVKMYQYGNEIEGKQKYYIGLLDENPLTYPDMGRNIGNADVNVALGGVNPATVKSAVGTATANKYELLALAALFLAEGRRNPTTLLTHLLLMDLIEARVKFGSGNNKVRTLRRAVDISGASAAKLGRYGTTAYGDSPLAHEGAVKDARAVARDAETEDSRYRDKTISIAVQWVAHYFSSPQFLVEPCKPSDVRPDQVRGRLETYATSQTVNMKKKSSEKARQFERRKEATIEQNMEAAQSGVRNAIVAFIQTLFNTRLKFAKGETPAKPQMAEVSLGNLKTAATFAGT